MQKKQKMLTFKHQLHWSRLTTQVLIQNILTVSLAKKELPDPYVAFVRSSSSICPRVEKGTNHIDSNNNTNKLFQF